MRSEVRLEETTHGSIADIRTKSQRRLARHGTKPGLLKGVHITRSQKSAKGRGKVVLGPIWKLMECQSSKCVVQIVHSGWHPDRVTRDEVARLVGRLGGDELPVRVRRGGIAVERPDVCDFAHLLGVTLNHIAALIAGD